MSDLSESVATRATPAERFALISGAWDFATPSRGKNERRNGPLDHALYSSRNLAERAINRLKQFGRIATRYEQRADNYSAMLQLGYIFVCI